MFTICSTICSFRPIKQAEAGPPERRFGFVITSKSQAMARPLPAIVAVWLLLVQPVNALLVIPSLIKHSPLVPGFNPAPSLSFRRISAVTRGGRTLQSLRCTATNDAAATEVSEAPPLQTTPPKRVRFPFACLCAGLVILHRDGKSLVWFVPCSRKENH